MIPSGSLVRAGWAVLLFAGAALACTGPTAAHHQVEIRDLAFVPPALTVELGDTVTWVNHDIVPHTVTGGVPPVESGPIAPGGSFTWVVVATGPLDYVCSYHPTMSGVLQVR